LPTRGRRAALLVVAAGAGCPSLSAHQTAEPLPPGRWRAGGALALVGLRDVEQETRIPGLQLELSARRGLAGDLDAGVKLYGVGLELDLKWRFLDGATQLAVAPALDLARTAETALTSDALHLFVRLPLLATWRWGPRQVTAGPSLLWGAFLPENGGHATGLMAGAFVNVAFRLGGGRWHLVPELDLYRTVAGEVPLDGAAAHLGLSLARDL
jgi:hypothetical protein